MARQYKVLSQGDIDAINKIVPKPAVNFMLGGPSKIHDEDMGWPQGAVQGSIGSSEVKSDADNGEDNWQQKVHDIICGKTINYVLSHLREIGDIPIPSIDIPELPAVDAFNDPSAALESKQNADMKESLGNVTGKMEELKSKKGAVKHMISHCPGTWDEYIETCPGMIEDDPPCARVHNKLITTCSKAFEGGEQVAAQCDKVAEEMIKWGSQYLCSLDIEQMNLKSQIEDTISNALEEKALQKVKKLEEKLEKEKKNAKSKGDVLFKFAEDYVTKQAQYIAKALFGI